MRSTWISLQPKVTQVNSRIPDSKYVSPVSLPDKAFFPLRWRHFFLPQLLLWGFVNIRPFNFPALFKIRCLMLVRGIAPCG